MRTPQRRYPPPLNSSDFALLYWDLLPDNRLPSGRNSHRTLIGLEFDQAGTHSGRGSWRVEQRAITAINEIHKCRNKGPSPTANVR